MLKRIYKLTYLFLFLFAVSLNLFDCHTNPAGPGLSIFNIYHNKILFTSSRSGNPQLYMMNPDGTNVIQLTSGKDSWSFQGIWSPNANSIAFTYGSIDTFYEIPPIYIMSINGSNRRIVGYGEPMSWSPDGSKIIVQAYDRPLYINNTNNTNTEIAEKTTLWGGLPDWSPDGKNIIYGYNIDSSNYSIKSYEKIVTYPGFDSVRVIGPIAGGGFRWSPNGKYFAFDELDHNLYIMNVDGSNTRKITDNNTSMAFANPRWSPDSNELIFLASTTDGSNKSYLYMINVNGTNIHRVIDDPTVTSVNWSK